VRGRRIGEVNYILIILSMLISNIFDIYRVTHYM